MAFQIITYLRDWKHCGWKEIWTDTLHKELQFPKTSISTVTKRKYYTDAKSFWDGDSLTGRSHDRDPNLLWVHYILTKAVWDGDLLVGRSHVRVSQTALCQE